MKSKGSIFSLLFFSITLMLLSPVFISCKKSETASPAPAPMDTIRPSSVYLPAYPGSYWVYKVNGGSATSTNAVGPLYVRDSMLDKFSRSYTPVMVPRYNNRSLWGNGYSATYNGKPHTCPWIDTYIHKGNIWHENHDVIGLQRFFLTVDTSLIISGKTYDKCVCVREYICSTIKYNGGITSDSFYAKDIGVIKQITYNWRKEYIDSVWVQIPADSIKDVYELSSYFINKR